jgi:hypothetical protein
MATCRNGKKVARHSSRSIQTQVMIDSGSEMEISSRISIGMSLPMIQSITSPMSEMMISKNLKKKLIKMRPLRKRKKKFENFEEIPDFKMLK